MLRQELWVTMSPAQTLVGSSPVAFALNSQIDRAARSDAKILITGESGTGKEVAAGLIHEHSRRRMSSLTTINCAGIPDSLLESELFGFRRRSFTGALPTSQDCSKRRNGGTLFMDEVAEMSLRMQGTVLRFLETGEIQPIEANTSADASTCACWLPRTVIWMNMSRRARSALTCTIDLTSSVSISRRCVNTVKTSRRYSITSPSCTAGGTRRRDARS